MQVRLDTPTVVWFWILSYPKLSVPDWVLLNAINCIQATHTIFVFFSRHVVMNSVSGQVIPKIRSLRYSRRVWRPMPSSVVCQRVRLSFRRIRSSELTDDDVR